MGIILVITDHDAVEGVEGVDDKYIYEIQYRSKTHLIETPLEFHDEMSVGDQERFIGMCMVEAFNREREAKLEQRPQEIVDKFVGEDADTDDDDDGEYGDDAQIHIVDLLNQMMSRLEDLEIKMNKDKPKEGG